MKKNLDLVLKQLFTLSLTLSFNYLFPCNNKKIASNTQSPAYKKQHSENPLQTFLLSYIKTRENQEKSTNLSSLPIELIGNIAYYLKPKNFELIQIMEFYNAYPELKKESHFAENLLTNILTAKLDYKNFEFILSYFSQNPEEYNRILKNYLESNKKKLKELADLILENNLDVNTRLNNDLKNSILNKAIERNFNDLIKLLLVNPDIDLNKAFMMSNQDSGLYYQLISIILKENKKILKLFANHPKLNLEQIDELYLNSLIRLSKIELGTYELAKRADKDGVKRINYEDDLLEALKNTTNTAFRENILNLNYLHAWIKQNPQIKLSEKHMPIVDLTPIDYVLRATQNSKKEAVQNLIEFLKEH